ncbi:MAG: sensor domain-containing diguanylate cyclase [Spirochaetales bacterium]|nr:sensor domain-containing diguanylate cyclase [Spirochaetales bacterium]
MDPINHALEKELNFRKALVTLTNELLSANLDKTFYQTALERTVELVPGAEGGSVIIRHDDGLYHYEAAVQFDFKVLKKVTLTDTEMGERSHFSRIEKIQIQDYETRLSPEKISLFSRAGKLNKIRATLSVPLGVNDKTMGFMNLDNFDHTEAFTTDDIETAEAIAAQISLALWRLVLEKTLTEERARFEFMAHHDPLTSLPNRRLFLDSLRQAMALSQRADWLLGVLYVDLNKFKQINDTYGHEAGDFVLRETAIRLRASVREADMAARLGGDEFGVLLYTLSDEQDLVRVRDKISKNLKKPMYFQDEVFHVQGAIGWAIFPTQATDENDLLRIADRSMYDHKVSDPK